MEPGRRHASLEIESELAHICLRFSATTNPEVTEVVFSYDLEILPVLMQYKSHADLFVSPRHGGSRGPDPMVR